MALGQNMPEIIKEKRLIESLDDNSKKCLKTLCEVLESQQQKHAEGGGDIDQFRPSSEMKEANDNTSEFGVS